MPTINVATRIAEISNDQLQQLIERIKESLKFSIQLNESTDIRNSAQLLAHVRYCYNNNIHNIHEDIFFAGRWMENKHAKTYFKR